MAHFEKETACEELYKGRIFDLRRHEVTLEDGSPAVREVIHHNGGVCVAALDEQARIFLVRQFRFPTGQEQIELPAGKLEKGENPMEAAFRELEEETGYCSKYLSPLGSIIPTPAYCTEVIHMFTTSKVTPTAQNLDEGEFLSVLRVPFAEAVQMVLQGDITDAKTQVGILMLKARLDAEKA
ncbi:MAG: NUDIX hydrolase [Angelakisella sp.]